VDIGKFTYLTKVKKTLDIMGKNGKEMPFCHWKVIVDCRNKSWTKHHEMVSNTCTNSEEILTAQLKYFNQAANLIRVSLN